MKKTLIANWKENPKNEKMAIALFRAATKVRQLDNIQTIICPPFIYLEKIAGIAQSLHKKNHPLLGAQDVFWEDKGAYTGEVGPAMLKKLGVKYVIVGHSERRQWLNETDSMINKKIKAALDAGLHIILCVGESAVVRKKGIVASERFVKSQLVKDLKGISFDKKTSSQLMVAYEPIWAIGTGRSSTPKEAALMISYIKKTLTSHFAFRNFKVLYGGSVNNKNVDSYIQCNEIDGALVGGASLKAETWKAMVGKRT